MLVNNGFRHSVNGEKIGSDTPHHCNGNCENDKKRESLTSNPSPKGKGSNVFRSSSYHIYLSLRIASLAFWKEIRGKAFSFLHLYLI